MKDKKDEKQGKKEINWWLIATVGVGVLLALSIVWGAKANQTAQVTPTVSTNVDQTTVFAAVATPNCQEFGATFGRSGSFHAEWDSNFGTCVLGMWEGSRISEGITLSELKEQGDDFTFLMPFDGYINQSANTIFVNDIKCTPGNPVSCDGITLFEKNTPVHIVSEQGNDSSGVMLIQKP